MVQQTQPSSSDWGGWSSHQPASLPPFSRASAAVGSSRGLQGVHLEWRVPGASPWVSFLRSWQEPLEDSRSAPCRLVREGGQVWGSYPNSPAFWGEPSHLI